MRISIQRDGENKTLSLFNNGIEIDYNLLKHKKREEELMSEPKQSGFGPQETESPENWKRSSFNISRGELNFIENPQFSPNIVMGGVVNLPQITDIVAVPKAEEKTSKGFFARVKRFLLRGDGTVPNIPSVPPIPPPPPPPPPKPPVTEVFRMIISNKEELETMKGKVAKLRALMKKAQDNGQVALAEKIRNSAEITFQEEQLVVNKFTRVVSEKQMIEFVMGYEKELSLSYIKNYVRHIPDNVTDRKKAADLLEIFDNYIILNYDPEDKSAELTQEQRAAELARKRDPILFGLIRGSRKFYFIGDWKDEYCDLTFDKFLEKYSEDCDLSIDDFDEKCNKYTKEAEDALTLKEKL